MSIDISDKGVAHQVTDEYLEVTEFHRVVIDGTVYVHVPGERVDVGTAKAHGLLDDPEDPGVDEEDKPARGRRGRAAAKATDDETPAAAGADEED